MDGSKYLPYFHWHYSTAYRFQLNSVDESSPLQYVLCKVPPHIGPNTGTAAIKWYSELSRLQIVYKLPVYAAGIASSLLTCNAAGSGFAVWVSAESKTALNTLLDCSFLLAQGIHLRIKYWVFTFFSWRREILWTRPLVLLLGVAPVVSDCGSKHWVSEVVDVCRTTTEAATTSLQARKQMYRELCQDTSRKLMW